MQRAICGREHVVENLGAADGALVIDETGFLKKGNRSAGVARQYSGTAGRVGNCQIGVFPAYASGRGPALIDRELCLPKEWAEDDARRDGAEIAPAVPFAAKPQLAGRMIARALAAGVPFAWVTGEEVSGSDPCLRMFLKEHERPFVLAVRSNEKLWSVLAGRLGRQAAADPATALPAAAWRRLSAGRQGRAAVRPGPRASPPPAGAAPGSSPGQHLGALAADPAPPTEARGVRLPCRLRAGQDDPGRAGAGGRRWTIEECFEAGKQEVGSAITRSAAGTAGIATSPWPCWRWPFPPRCGPSSAGRQGRTKRGAPISPSGRSQRA